MILLSGRITGQSTDPWTAFYNKDSSLVGFKDRNGIVRIEPNFDPLFAPRRFDDIIEIFEDINGNFNYIYLTKSGKIIGMDSAFIFDNGPDCESEGFIRFEDKKNRLVGMFNRNGNIAIPAEYNALSRVTNGLIFALKGATKKSWPGGEHYSWVGGNDMLIDTANSILIDSFPFTESLNIYSLQVSVQPNPDTTRENFKTNNGSYFSFVNFDKEFMSWLKSGLLANFTKENLLNASYDTITIWQEPSGWTKENKNKIIEKNYEIIKAKLIQLISKDCDHYLFTETLNPYQYDPVEYPQYFNNCGQYKSWRYPVKNIVFNYNRGKELVQDHFEFLRTDKGYKLISLTIRNGKLKYTNAPRGTGTFALLNETGFQATAWVGDFSSANTTESFARANAPIAITRSLTATSK